MKDLILTLLAILVFSVSCEKRGYNETFSKIDLLCDKDPQQAINKLESMDYDNLSEHDRHCHDLLTIKARDKAYITHTSDSLILDVIEYFSSNSYKFLYPEALYYGGRVCSDMRNYPQAMKFYQLAINNLTDTESNLELRRAILSQCAHILNNVGLNSKALPYMEEVITISYQLNDSTAIAYNNILAAELYLNCRNTSFSKKHIMEAYKYSGCLDETDRSWLNVSFASLLQMENKTDSALKIIRPCIQKVDSTCLNYTLANAAEIYLAAGYTDSACMFARKLLSNNNDDNHTIGYSIVLSDKMEQAVSTDSLRMLLEGYKYSLTKVNENNNAATIIIQQNHTIPSNHSNLRIVLLFIVAAIITIATFVTIIRIKQREKRIKTHPAETPYDTLIQNTVIKDKTVNDETSQIVVEREKIEIGEKDIVIDNKIDNNTDDENGIDNGNSIDIKQDCDFDTSMVDETTDETDIKEDETGIEILDCDINKSTVIELKDETGSTDHETDTEILDSEVNNSTVIEAADKTDIKEDETDIEIIETCTNSTTELVRKNKKKGRIYRVAEQKKNELMAELMSRIDSKGSMKLSATITDSNVYTEMIECVHANKSIIYNVRIWKELQETVLSDSPEFMIHLRTLVLPKCSKANVETALLIRCGFRHHEMTKLLNITKSSVSDRRTRLCNLIFEDKEDHVLLERLIFLL